MFRLNHLYAYNDIRIIHLELTSRCQAACPMCSRNLNGGALNEAVRLNDISAAEFEDWFPDKFLRHLDGAILCGNYGDPIVAKDCLPILRRMRALNARMWLSLNTNGSARSSEFWAELGALGCIVHFGIDGAGQASHAKYRRNTDFDQILENAKTFIAAGGDAVWDMLVFRHNEDEVEAARALAADLGFRKFVVKSTTRFGSGDTWPVQDAEGRQEYVLEPSRILPPPASPQVDLASCPIACRVRAEKSIYVSAQGMVMPCCWLGQTLVEAQGPRTGPGKDWMASQIETLEPMLEEIGAQHLSLHHLPLEEIVTYALPEVAARWEKGAGRLDTCARLCGRLNPVDSEAVAVTERRDPYRPGLPVYANQT